MNNDVKILVKKNKKFFIYAIKKISEIYINIKVIYKKFGKRKNKKEKNQ